MKIIALAQQKGGVGKSTLAINLAGELIRRKKNPAIVDLDPQGSVTNWAKRRTDGGHGDKPIVIASDAISLRGHLADLKGRGIDFAILDLPGRNAAVANDGMRASDLVVVPARPGDMDIEASGETLAAAQRMQRPYVFVMSIAPARGNRTEKVAEGLAEAGHPVLSVYVMERVAFSDAIGEGLSIAEYEPKGKADKEIGAFTSAVLERIK